MTKISYSGLNGLNGLSDLSDSNDLSGFVGALEERLTPHLRYEGCPLIV